MHEYYSLLVHKHKKIPDILKVSDNRLVQSNIGHVTSCPLPQQEEGRDIVCICVHIVMVTNRFLATHPSSYLAVPHGVAEEAVKQQVLQLCIPVESLLDLPQEHTDGTPRPKPGVKGLSIHKHRSESVGLCRTNNGLQLENSL